MLQAMIIKQFQKCRPDSKTFFRLSESCLHGDFDEKCLRGAGPSVYHANSCGAYFFYKFRNFVLLAFLACLSFSCQNDTVYHTYQAIPENFGWGRGDSLNFYFPPGIPPAAYTLEVGIRNTDMYPYRDIWLEATKVMSDTLPAVTDTLHFYLADENGRWNEDRSAGGYYQSTFVCDEPLVIGTDSFNRSLHIIHVMRDNPLPGIADVGIRLLRK